MSKPKSTKHVTAKQGIKVKAHSSPPPSIPLILPTSPDMIPAFVLDETIVAGVDVDMPGKSLKRDRNTAFQMKLQTNKSSLNSREKFKINQKETKQQPNRNHKLGAQNRSIPLNINKPTNQKSRKSSTFTNLGNVLQKPERKALTSRAADETDDFLKTFLKSDFPPYNPDDFTPKDEGVSASREPMSDEELLKNIRQELDQWLYKCPEKKKSCPEQWTSVPSKSMYLLNRFLLFMH